MNISTLNDGSELNACMHNLHIQTYGITILSNLDCEKVGESDFVFSDLMHDKTNKQIGAVCDTSIVEPLCEKTGLRASRPGPIKNGLCSHRRSLSRDLKFRN